MTNWWCLLHLVDARQAAVAFLEAHKREVKGKPLAALERALGLYRQEAELLELFRKQFAGFIQWQGGTRGVAEWDAKTRERQQALLDQARLLEEQALAGLEEVLALEGVARRTER